MSELPKGWAELPIGQICRVIGGSTPKTAVSANWDGEIAWLTPDDLSRHREKVVKSGARSITQAGYKSCSTTLVPAGTVLFTSRAPIGYTAIAGVPMCTNQGFKSFVPPSGVSPSYLYWYLRYATPAIQRMGTGTTFAEISKRVAESIPLRLAPQPEQERIVAAIEEQFSRLDNAEKSLQRARLRVEALRGAAVSVATSGDWPVKRLSDVTLLQEYGSSTKATAEPDGGVPMIRMGNIQNGRIVMERLKFLPSNHHDVERYQLRDGDLLFNRTNSPELVGKSAVFVGAREPVAFASYLIRVRLDETCSPHWVAMYINGPRGRTWAADVRSQQVGQANINGTKLAALELPIPPREVQDQHVSEAERQLSILDSLSAAVDRALERSRQLRRAILERAFSGRLVAQDPSDEPASALLERIDAESAKEQPVRRVRRRAKMEPT